MWVCTLHGIYLGTLHSLSVAVEADTLVMCSPRVQAWPSGPSKPPSRKCASDGWRLVAHPAPRRCGVRVPAMYACASHEGTHGPSAAGAQAMYGWQFAG